MTVAAVSTPPHKIAKNAVFLIDGPPEAQVSMGVGTARVKSSPYQVTVQSKYACRPPRECSGLRFAAPSWPPPLSPSSRCSSIY